MNVHEGHGKAPLRLRPSMIVLAAVTLIALVVIFTTSGNSPHGNGKSSGGSGSARTSSTLPPLALMSSVPASGATSVLTDTSITLTFSSPVSLHKVQPTLAPPVAGTWSQASDKTLLYNPTAPFIPGSQEVVTVPSGSSGLRGTNGDALVAPATVDFSLAAGDTLRLQQLLAQLQFLPLTFTPTGPAGSAKELAIDQPGSFAFRWSTLPTELTSQWTPGVFGEITKAAVMAFENQNNLKADGLAGPQVWTSLLGAAEAQKIDTNPYVYVLVNKVQPENLTLYNDGATDLSGILVNTGAPGADTTDGTYAVFEHVRFSEMKGTNPDGTTYDDPNIPYASYFNGGDALHGYIRASYGFPQSNGCVEMSYANAAVVWPLTPIGTLVTVEGPATPAPPTTTTTTTSTTTAPPGATTTTAPPPPPTTPAP